MNTKRHLSLFAATAVAVLTLNVAPSAIAEPINFKQTHYFKLFGREDAGGAAERAGYEADNRAYPSTYVAPATRAKAADDADRLEKRGHGHRGAWTLLGPTNAVTPG